MSVSHTFIRRLKTAFVHLPEEMRFCDVANLAAWPLQLCVTAVLLSWRKITSPFGGMAIDGFVCGSETSPQGWPRWAILAVSSQSWFPRSGDSFARGAPDLLRVGGGVTLGCRGFSTPELWRGSLASWAFTARSRIGWCKHFWDLLLIFELI